MKTTHFAILVTSVLLSAGCGLRDSHTNMSAVCGSAVPESSGALSSFQSSVYAFTTQTCAGCHGASTSPLFATSDVGASYAATKALVTFSNISQSRLLVKATDGHSGAAVATNRDPLIRALTEWTQAEAGAGTTTPQTRCTTAKVTHALSTTSKALPANIPTSLNDYVDMEFNMEEASSEAKATTFIVGIQIFQSDNRFYRFKNARIKTGTDTIYLKDPIIMVNNQREERYSFLVDGTAAANRTTALSVTPLIIPRTGSSDQVAISFTDLHKGGAPTLQDVGGNNNPETTFFLASVKPILFSRCIGCHANVAAYRMPNNDDVMLRANTVTKVDTMNETGSLLYRKATNMVAHQGGNALANMAERNTLIQWMQMLP